MPVRIIAFVLVLTLLPATVLAAEPSPRRQATGYPALAARAAHLRALADSVQQEPGRGDLWLSLGRICSESGQARRARQAFERATRCVGVDPSVWLELALAWKRDWLYSAERASLDSVQVICERACMATPDEIRAWTLLAGLEILRGHPLEALQHALHARVLAPEDGEALLVTGAACTRLGMTELADSAYIRARGHLPAALLEYFDGVPGEHGRVTGGQAARNAWAASDPDLTTPENEAHLDYLARLALASVLFREGNAVRWDMRAALFVQYGPPATIEYNPAAAQLGELELGHFVPRRKEVKYAPDPLPFPYNMQVWSYPELGLVVTLWDRSLSQHYDLPVEEDQDAEPRAAPEQMAANGYVEVPGARGAYRSTPPGARILEVQGVISRFPGVALPRVLANVFAPGVPSDSLVAAWAIADSGGRVVVRSRQPMLRSACDPEARCFTTFDGTVPAGDYRVDVSIRGGRHQYGVAHLHVHLEPTPASLVMSDLVVLCGDRLLATAAEGVRLEPAPAPRVRGRAALTVYYELDHLAIDAGGGCRYAYTYEVRRVEATGSAEPVVQATREESFAGGVRRQFVTVPMAELRPGAYELRMTVHDLVARTQVTRSASFARD